MYAKFEKFREYILKLSIENGEHGRTDGQTDRHRKV